MNVKRLTKDDGVKFSNEEQSSDCSVEVSQRLFNDARVIAEVKDYFCPSKTSLKAALFHHILQGFQSSFLPGWSCRRHQVQRLPRYCTYHDSLS